MVIFVNAKINIGLQITRRREDGYHELSTLFYPVGLYAGGVENPESFCDILEVTPRDEQGVRLSFTGRDCGCAPEHNLVWKAAQKYFHDHARTLKGADIILEKHLPSGAGLGGGSADASFTLLALNETERLLSGCSGLPNQATLAAMAKELGADCPFFIYNRPLYAEGIGEKFEEVQLDLTSFWCLIAKPRIFISTKEAFSGVSPKPGDFDLRKISVLPIEEWQGVIRNDFEESVFPKYPELHKIKEMIRGAGALYCSMSGSGSAIYGIFQSEEIAHKAKVRLQKEATIEGVYLLKM